MLTSRRSRSRKSTNNKSIEGFTRRERAALDLRVDALLAENLRGEIDNPLSIAYIVDALGATSRVTYVSGIHRYPCVRNEPT